jgi:leucyl/phenylalanyl-tRNA--protein transferase
MFHRERDASKVCLVHLAARLKAGGFRLLDAQFTTEHLVQFGAIELSRTDYQRALNDALEGEADFYLWGAAAPITGGVALQSISHTS